MSPKAKRLLVVVAITALLGIAVMLVLGALRENIVFFTRQLTSRHLAQNRVSLKTWRFGQGRQRYH